MKLTIYADGGARGNPGPAGSGAVLKDEDGELVAEVSEYIGETTNNQAEYKAIIFALQKAKELRADDLDVFLDSELAVKQLNGEYKVKNAEIAKRFLEIHNLLPSFKSVRFRHVYRAKNAEADALVNKAIDAHLKDS